MHSQRKLQLSLQLHERKRKASFLPPSAPQASLPAPSLTYSLATSLLGDTLLETLYKPTAILPAPSATGWTILAATRPGSCSSSWASAFRLRREITASVQTTIPRNGEGKKGRYIGWVGKYGAGRPKAWRLKGVAKGFALFLGWVRVLPGFGEGRVCCKNLTV